MLKSEFLGKSGYSTQDFLGGSLSLMTTDTRRGLTEEAVQTVAAMKEHISGTDSSKMASFNKYVEKIAKSGEAKQQPQARSTAKMGSGM